MQLRRPNPSSRSLLPALLAAAALLVPACSSSDAATPTTTKAPASSSSDDSSTDDSSADDSSEAGDDSTEREAPDEAAGRAIAEAIAEWQDTRDEYTTKIVEVLPVDQIRELLTGYRTELYLLDGAVRDVELSDSDLRRAVTRFQELTYEQISSLDSITSRALTASDGRDVAIINAAVDTTVADLEFAAFVATGEIDPELDPIGEALVDLSDEATGRNPVAYHARRGICVEETPKSEPLVETGMLFQDEDGQYGQRVLVFADADAAAAFVEESAESVDDCVGESEGDITSAVVDEKSVDDGIVVNIAYVDGVPTTAVLRADGVRVVVARVALDGNLIDGAVPEAAVAGRADSAEELAVDLAEQILKGR